MNTKQPVVPIRPRFVFPNILQLGIRLLAAMAISFILLTASRMIEAIYVFLFTSPSSPDAEILITTALNSAATTAARAFGIFIIAGVVALTGNKLYMRPTLQGIGYAIAAYGFWLLAALGLVFWTKTQNMPNVPMVFPIISAIAGFGVAKKGSEVFAIARQQMLRSADEILAKSSCSPILYLRAFSTDNASAPDHYSLEKREHRFLTWRVLNPAFWTERRDWTFEEVLCRGLSSLTAVVAIGKPDEPLPKIGAARKYLSHSDWKQEVAVLLEICRFCCLVVGHSDGLLWEVKYVLTFCPPEKVLILVSPDDERAWSFIVRLIANKNIERTLPKNLPESTLGVVFTKNWDPIILTGRQLISSYREIAFCMEERKWIERS